MPDSVVHRAGSVSEAAGCADNERVKSAHPLFRRSGACCLLLAGLGIAAAGAGCATTAETRALAKDGREAEIAVTNLTAYPWRIAVRTLHGADVKTVSVQPRESFAMVIPGDEYEVEQTLLASPTTGGGIRTFTARFEPGQHYRWSLATLLSNDDSGAP
jgi:hypothetical protein